MKLTVLEFNVATNEVVDVNGSTIDLLPGEKDLDKVLAEYSTFLGENSPETIIVDPIIAHIGDSTDSLVEIHELCRYGIPSATVDELGIDVKQLSKDDFVTENKDEIPEKLTEEIEEDLKDAVDCLAEEDGAKSTMSKIKFFASKGGNILLSLKIILSEYSRLFGNGVDDKYMKLSNRINDKLKKLKAITKDKVDKKTFVKKLSAYALTVLFNAIKLIMGAVKFTADIIIAIAKYAGRTVVSITKDIGVVGADIVNAFKKDFIKMYKPIVA